MIYLTRVSDDKLLHETAWALLSYALGGGELPPVCFGPHGKPGFAGGPFFSIAHTKGLALCAVEDWETGLDAEYERAFSPRLQERIFTPDELALAAGSDSIFTTLWTLKESYMKYTGMGLSQGANTLNFRFANGQPVLDGQELHFRTAVWEGFHISQCGPEPFELKLCPVDFCKN